MKRGRLEWSYDADRFILCYHSGIWCQQTSLFSCTESSSTDHFCAGESHLRKNFVCWDASFPETYDPNFFLPIRPTEKGSDRFLATMVWSAHVCLSRPHAQGHILQHHHHYNH